MVSQGMVLSVGNRVAGRANGTTVDEGGGSSPCAGLVLADLPQLPPSTVAGVLRASSVPGSPSGEPTRLRPPRWDSLDALEGQRVVDDVCSREHGVRAHVVPLGTPLASPRRLGGRRGGDATPLARVVVPSPNSTCSTQPPDPFRNPGVGLPHDQGVPMISRMGIPTFPALTECTGADHRGRHRRGARLGTIDGS